MFCVGAVVSATHPSDEMPEHARLPEDSEPTNQKWQTVGVVVSATHPSAVMCLRCQN